MFAHLRQTLALCAALALFAMPASAFDTQARAAFAGR